MTYNDFFASHKGFRLRVDNEEKPAEALINEHRKWSVLVTVLVGELPDSRGTRECRGLRFYGK